LDNSRQNIIKEIAQELDCGFDCYYNSKTNEIVTIPNFSHIADEDDFKEAFRADLEKVKKHQPDFIKIEVLQSFESFKLMELFVEQLTDKKLQSELENVLANKKPFQNFKNKIDNSDFRQDWFDFKKNELEKRVETELNSGKASVQSSRRVRP
jgi:ribosomal protein L11 methylase PrmA